MQTLVLGWLLLGVLTGTGCAAAANLESTSAPESAPQSAATFTREADVIYHKEGGYALTLERVTPAENANGAAVVMVVSGGWVSSHDFTQPHAADQLPGFLQVNAAELVRRGYTLFYVVHGSQPKFTIREIDAQLVAAVRHIRFHAAGYGVEPDRIGIMGGSAGGHLSLMRGTKGEEGLAEPTAPADTSSRVQAVVAYYPPTDFLNFGGDGVFFDQVVRRATPEGRNPYLQALDYLEFDAVEMRLNKVTDADRLAEHYEYVGPFYHVTEDDAPTLILHGNVDRLVPLQQSELIVERFKQEGVLHELYVKDGGDHGWVITPEEAQLVANWFDRHL